MSVLSFLTSLRPVSPAVLRGGMLPVGWQGVTRRALSGLELEWLAGLPVLEDGQGGWCAVTREGEAERLWDAQMWRGLVRMYLERGGALVGWDDAGRPWAVSTLHIESTPQTRPSAPTRFPWWAPMNSTISGVAGRFRPRRKRPLPSKSRWRA